MPSNIRKNPTAYNIDELAHIIEIQQAIATSDFELEGLMQLVCEKTQMLTNASGAVVEMAEGSEMVYRSCSGTLEKYLGVRLDINQSLSGRSVISGEVLYCKDSETDPRVDKEASRKVGARSMICVPLYHKTKIVGVLKVVSPNVEAFTEDKIRLLGLLAGLLSATLSHASDAHEKNQALEKLKRSEAALRESEARAQEAVKAKSEFLANMSHEIRTPINGILGMVDLLLDSKLQYQQKEYAEIIKKSTDTLLVLVNDILDISKIEAKKLTLENINFDLWQLFEDVRKSQTHIAAKKGLFFTCMREPNVPRLVSGDPTRLIQIISNLINNAIKFTESGSVTVKASKEGEYIKFEVEDTGIGISADARSKMFQPFSQLDNSTTRKFGGTGLGLSICRELTAAMHGQIGVESEPNKGSTFWFTVKLGLPQEEVGRTNNSVPLEKVPQNDFKLHILVAEDNSVNQIITSKMLLKLGHTVDIVNNGVEVLKALKNKKYDLILMDCQMPKMDGYEASREIRNHVNHEWSKIPIIAMTAHALEGEKEKCVEAGMDDYVSKPTKFELLSETIDRVMKSKKVA